MRADPWVVNELCEQLVCDWYELFIFSERDMQSAAYFWVRKYFDRNRTERWRVRNEPIFRLRDGTHYKPDLVVFKDGRPVDAFELKCHLRRVDLGLWDKDLTKLCRLKDECKLRHAYQLVLYDAEGVSELASQKEPWMKRYLTFVGANVRRHEYTCRLRRGYHDARRLWEHNARRLGLEGTT